MSDASQSAQSCGRGLGPCFLRRISRSECPDQLLCCLLLVRDMAAPSADDRLSWRLDRESATAVQLLVEADHRFTAASRPFVVARFQHVSGIFTRLEALSAWVPLEASPAGSCAAVLVAFEFVLDRFKLEAGT